MISMIVCSEGNCTESHNDLCVPLQDMIKAFQQSQVSQLRKNVLGDSDDYDDDDESSRTQGPPKPEKRKLQSTLSSSSLYGTDVVVEEHRQLVESIARHVIHGQYLIKYLCNKWIITLKLYCYCIHSF